MNSCLFILKNELNYYLILLEIIPFIYLNYEKIIIIIDKKYFFILNQLFYKWKNVVLYFIDNKLNKKKRVFDFSKCYDINEFINEIKYTFNIPYLLNNNYYRLIEQEKNLYNYFIDIFNNKYIFYYNKNIKCKIINYFGKDFIYNPYYNFYDNYHLHYKKWIKLKILNICDYFTIIENAEEIHIYDDDILYLINNLNLKNKPLYFYTPNKEFKIKLNNNKNIWEIIYI